MAIEAPKPETAMTPAAPERANIPAEALSTMRLKLGDKIYCLPLAPLMAEYSEENAPAILSGKGVTGKAAALRSLLKGGLTLAWPLVTDLVKTLNRGFSARGLPLLPLPDLKTRHKDGLLYFIQYGMAILFTIACSVDWEAESEPMGSDDRYVRLTNFSSSALAALEESVESGESRRLDSDDAHSRS